MIQASATNNLQLANSSLCKEWHPTKNGDLTPNDVTPFSNRKVWWLCNEKGHEWQASVGNRNRGRGCPYCSGKKVCKDNCLQTINSILAKEWHPTKNENLTPYAVTPFSNKKVWWLCNEKGHEWQASVSSRNRGRGCPYCSGRNACKEYNLQVINPSLAKEWHPTKNGDLTPFDVTPHAGKLVWWSCTEKGHEWKASMNTRDRSSKCPYCYGKKKLTPIK